MEEPNYNKKLDVLFCDDSLLAVNKPAGLLSIPDGYNPHSPHLASVLNEGFGKVWIVHRLDRDTSGVILLARNLSTHRELNLQFERRQIKKQYHALIIGLPEWDSIEINTPLQVNGDRKHRTVPAPATGKPAQTEIRVIQRFSDSCLVEAVPHTGYTHQIRAHLASIHFPILGDPLYQGFIPKEKANTGLNSRRDIMNRLALHARSIAFLHPLNHEKITIEAPYFVDFLTAIQTLTKNSRL